jgi:hypothetical protein
VPTEDEPVRAVDVLGPYAAVYRFSVDESGAWFENCTIALKDSDDRWQETTAGGAHGGGWEVPWRPSSLTLDGHTVSVFGTAGMHLPDEQDRTVFVRGIYGFADMAVRWLRVTSEAGQRTVEVNSPAGAFVVVVLGDGAVDLHGLDQRGADLGEPATNEAIQDSPLRRRRAFWPRTR